MDDNQAGIEIAQAASEEEMGDVFFVERTGDKFIFPCYEKEAWNILRNRSNWQRSDFRIIGTSDGKTYKKFINEAKSQKQGIRDKLNGLNELLAKYEKAEEKFLYEDLLEPTDPKVLKVQELINKIASEIEPIELELKNFSVDLIKKAWAAELEVARLTPRMPTNQLVDTPGGDRAKILRMMGHE